MSIRELTGRLNDAKRQVAQASTVGGHSAATANEAAELVRTVLDGVQDKTLADAISGQAEAVGKQFTSAVSVSAGIDRTIRNLQAVGTDNR